MNDARLRRLGLTVIGLIGAVVLGEVISILFSGHTVPTAILAQAVVFGSLNAMFAVGLVLVYRAGRIVNFAHGSLGVMGATLFVMLTLVERWSFWLALPLAVGAAAATGFAVELFVVRRLAKAPRLALTVVTIGVGQVLLAMSGLLPRLFISRGDPPPQGRPSTPFSHFTFKWFPIVMTGNHILIVVVALVVMGALAAFFRFTSAGIAVRGAAENDDRAEQLGINVNSLSSLVWVIAAVLSGLAAILNLTISASGGLALGAVGAASAGILLRALAAAVVGRMESLPVTVAAAIGISLFEQCMLWAFNTTSFADLGMLLLIIGVLLLQRGKQARTEESATGTWAAATEVREIPVELKNVPAVRAGARRFYLVIGALVLAYPWVMSPSQVIRGGVIVIYGIIVISLVVLTGWGGQISLGQFGFVAVGAAIGGAMTAKWHIPFLIALPAASMVGALVAVLLGLPAMRIKGLFLAITTLAFSVVVSTVFLSRSYFGWLLPQDNAIKRPKFLFIDTNDQRAYFYLCVLGLLFALWVAQGLRHSRSGRVLIAMRDNERTAQSFGVNRIRTRLATFAVSGFLAAFAGVLLAHHQHSVRATAFPPEQSIQIFLIAVIGGLGSVPGSLVGALYYGFVIIFIPNAFGQLLAGGVGVMVILLFYPGGMGGAVFAIRDSWLRRVAMRNWIFVPSLTGDFRVLDGEFTRANLAPKDAAADAPSEVPVRFRIPSVIGVRGESQQARGWRWQ